MENERTKELAYLFDQEENEMESLMETAEEAAEDIAEEDEVIAPAEKKKLTKEQKKLERQRQKKRKKEHFPKKTGMNLFYKVDRATGPATIMFYIAVALVVILIVGKVGVFDLLQDVSSLEQQISGMEAQVQDMTDAAKDFKQIKAEYNRYTQGYLQEGEMPIDRLVLLDMLEETVFDESNLESASIVDDGIFISYTGLNLEETSALVKELEEYQWVKEVTIQNASLATDQKSGVETISTSMIIEIYATMEEVPANE